MCTAKCENVSAKLILPSDIRVLLQTHQRQKLVDQGTKNITIIPDTVTSNDVMNDMKNKH